MFMLLYPVAVALLVASVVAAAPGLPRRHSGAARRCPGCGCDVSEATHLRCPACDHTWTTAREVERRPLRLGRVMLGLVIFTLGAASAWTAFVEPAHWTDLVPRPVLREVLELSVETPRPAPDSRFPAADPALFASGDRWDDLVAQQQEALAIDVFAALVDAADGSPGSVDDLALAAQELHASSLTSLPRDRDDAWLVYAAVDRARAQREALDERAVAGRAPALGSFLASELQAFDDDVFLAADWVEPAVSFLELVRYSGRPATRRYAVSRLKYVRGRWAETALLALRSDPDPDVADAARVALSWRARVLDPGMDQREAD